MNSSNPSASSEPGRNRRLFARVPAGVVPQLTARVVGGPQVRLIDISQRGALVETTLHLRPGRPVSIRFVAADTTFTLTGAVVRSSVAVLDDQGVKYHTALSFKKDVQFCPDPPLAPAFPADRPGAPAPGRAGAVAVHRGAEAVADDVMMMVAAPGETGEALRERLLANSW